MGKEMLDRDLLCDGLIFEFREILQQVIFKRELSSYFSQPTAYAIIVVFLLLSLGFTFTFGNFMRVGDASLEYSFFFWHPWVFMVLVPAVGMKLWSDEQRTGTIELLGTFPISVWSAIFGKYLASCLVWLVALLLTFPIVITVNWLGDPDNGVILASYLGSFLMAGAFLAIGSCISALTKNQVIAFIIAATICFLLVMSGLELVLGSLRTWAPAPLNPSAARNATHLSPMERGPFRTAICWTASITRTRSSASIARPRSRSNRFWTPCRNSRFKPARSRRSLDSRRARW